MKYLKDLKNFKNKTVIVRTDLDAPVEHGRLLDDYRIRMSVPTIKFLHQHGAKVVLLSKSGRPKKAFDPAASLAPAAHRLADLLDKKLVIYEDHLPDYGINHLIFFKGDIRKKENQQVIKNSAQKDIILLENIRFYKEEEQADKDFAKMLASLGDIYVFDAFAMAHRDESSVSGIAKYLPGYAGLNLQKEIAALNRILNLNKHPFLAMMGGAKISDKVGAIRNLGKRADKILLGGGPANLFFLAKGYEIGKSICERDKIGMANELIRNFRQKIILPLDLVVGKADFSGVRVCKPTEIKKNEAAYDIGPKTILEFSKNIKMAKKLVWNGPMGLYERRQFWHGTASIAMVFAARSKRNDSFGLIGGGDTLSAVDRAGLIDQIDFVSTGGGAMLDYLGGFKLPALEALK